MRAQRRLRGTRLTPAPDDASRARSRVLVRGSVPAVVLLGLVVLLAGPAAGATSPAATGTGTGTGIGTGAVAPPPGPAIWGQLLSEEAPAVGVRVSVEQDGTAIGSATSDARGVFVVRVPGPGVYAVTLDADSLPDGVELRDPERVRLDRVTVYGTSAQRVLFPFAGGEAVRESSAQRFADLVAAGLVTGLIVAVAAVGLSLIYGTTRLVNFAHGELVTLGALLAWFLNTGEAGPQLALVLAAIIAMVLSGAFGAGLEVGLWRPLVRRRTGVTARMLASIGLALFLRYGFQVVFGGSPRTFRQYSAQGPTDLGPFSLPIRDYVIVLVCLVALLGTAFLLQRTRLGVAIRAVSDERDLAAASGIDVNRVIVLVWVVGTALAGLAGVLLGVTESVQFNMGFQMLLTIFAAVVLGGIGSAYGAMLGALVVGVVQSVSTFWIPADFKIAIGLGVLIVVLLIRPQGILGVRERLG